MVAERSAAVKETYVTLKQLSEDENNRLIYEAHLTRIRDEKAERDLAFDQGMTQGIKQGIEQGIEQGNIAIAREMILAGESVSRIARFTGLDPAEIEGLV